MKLGPSRELGPPCRGPAGHLEFEETAERRRAAVTFRLITHALMPPAASDAIDTQRRRDGMLRR